MSFKKTSKKKNAPHKQKDYPEGVHKTAVTMVVDTVMEPTELHKKAVKRSGTCSQGSSAASPPKGASMRCLKVKSTST